MPPVIASATVAALLAAGPSTPPCDASRLATCPFSAFRLVAVDRNEPRAAHLVGPDGALRSVLAGTRFADGALEAVNAEGVVFAGRGVRLFERRPPGGPLIGEGVFSGHRESIDFEGDVDAFVALMAAISGADVIVEHGTRGTVRIAARDAPWDAIFAHGLRSAGAGYRQDEDIMRVAPLGRLATLPALPKAPPVTEDQVLGYTVHRAPVAEVARAIEKVSGRAVELPPGPHEPVTFSVLAMRWERLLQVLAVTRGWTIETEGSRIRLKKT